VVVRAEEIVDRLDGAKPTGPDAWTSLCPAHDDRNPSLSITLGDEERVLLHCHAGCSTEEVVDALGLTTRDLFAERSNGNGGKEIVATYDYTDEGGEQLLFQVVRYDPKDFRQRRPDGAGDWDWRLGDTRRVLYRLPAVVKAAKAGGRVAVVEGERDVERVEAEGLVATCNPGGAGKWRPEYAEFLRGAQVGVFADRDEPGRKHAAEVAASLDGIAASVKVLEPAEGKDVSDHLRAGKSLGELVEVEPGKPAASEGLPWRWGEELTDAAPEEPEWIFEGFLATGTKIIFAGLPKAGKTTFIASLIEAIASAAPTFLGRRIMGGPVLLASEEGDGTLAPKLSGLPAERVRVLNRDACWPKPPWSELIASAVAEAERTGAVVLAIDSMAFWAAFEPERENDAGAAQAIMDALDEACRAGLAVVLIHHQRKQPGANHGTGVRGSGALTGAPDAIIEYERLGEDAPHTQRRLVSLSRWPQTPEVLVIDWDRHGGAWRIVGEAGDRAGSDALGIRERLLSALPSEPPGPSEGELAGLLDLDVRKISGPLRELLDGPVNRVGEGKKGDPYRYHQNAPQNAPPSVGSMEDSNAPLPLMGGSIESKGPQESSPTGEKGCASHPDGRVDSCRYCKALAGEEI
jgi:5S rRNA maturation endonuclease (ribonuclease M5)